MSAGWGRFQEPEFQEQGSGPDWFAAAGEDGAPEWAAADAAAPKPSAGPAATGSGEADSGESADGAPGWAAPAAPGAVATPSGWATLADAAGDRRGNSSAAKKTTAKKTAAKKTAAKQTAAKKNAGGWSSRRKDRDPAETDEPKPPESREKLEQRAKNILTYHLGRQMQTRSQLADRLRKKEIPDDIAEAVLDRFQELHLLDDATYAEVFVRSRHSERGLAKRALGYELRKRGVDDETAAEALTAVDEDQEAATARRLVDSRLRATKGLELQVRTRRLVGMLARKGYSSSVAFKVVKEALAQEGQEVEFDDPGFD